MPSLTYEFEYVPARGWGKKSSLIFEVSAPSREQCAQKDPLPPRFRTVEGNLLPGMLICDSVQYGNRQVRNTQARNNAKFGLAFRNCLKDTEVWSKNA
jgi:hypothetical protein